MDLIVTARGGCRSPDGTRLVTGIDDRRREGNRLPGAVKVWDVQTGQKLLSLQGGGGSVAYSPDGNRLATSRNGPYGGGGGIGEVVVRDAQTGQELVSLMHTAFVSSAVYSPHGKRLVSSSGIPSAFESGEVKVWDAETGHELLNIKEGGWDKQVALSPSGHWLLVCTPSLRTVKIYDATPLPEMP